MDGFSVLAWDGLLLSLWYDRIKQHGILGYRFTTWTSVQGMVLLSYECNRKKGVWKAWRNKPWPKQRMCTVETFLDIKVPIRTAGGFCMLWLISSIVFLQHCVNNIFLTRALSYLTNSFLILSKWLTSIYKEVHLVFIGFWETNIRSFCGFFLRGVVWDVWWQIYSHAKMSFFGLICQKVHNVAKFAEYDLYISKLYTVPVLISSLYKIWILFLHCFFT